MLCPNVGLRGDTMSKNCRYCGAELPDNAGFCPKCGKQTQAEILPAQEQKHCQSCGAVLPSGARFCPKCRTATNAEQTVPYSGQPIAPFPVQNNAQPVLSAPMQKGIQQKQVSVWSRVFTVFLVVLLLAQTLIALFVRPGWLKHKSGSVTVSSEGIDLSALSESAYLVGLGDKAGNSSEFTETPVVSSETLAVPADGSAVTAECDAVIELGAHNALTVPELTVVKHEPDNESLPGGTRSYYEISAGEVHEFDYYFDIRLPYDPETADPENIEGSVFAEYLNEETNKWELIACDLDTEKNEVIIHTNHLSHFTPVTVKNSSEIYPLISTYEHYYVSDTAAANELKMILGKEINEFKEDPFVQDLFFYMFSTIGDGIIMNDPTGLFTAEDYAQFYKFSDKKDFIGSGTFKDTVDFAQFDGNGDGKIDATLFTVPTKAGDDDWWPCAGAFGDEAYRVDGVAVGHIITGNAQVESRDSYFNYISSYCHELGHCTGLPDYYLYGRDDREGLHGSAGIELMDTREGVKWKRI